MARDADGRPIRQRPETDGEDENLTEDESSYPRSKTQRRTGHNSKFAPLKGNPSDLNHRQKKVHIMMMLSHIQDSIDFKDELEKPRRHININENPDREPKNQLIEHTELRAPSNFQGHWAWPPSPTTRT